MTKLGGELRTTFMGEPLTVRETHLARFVYELATDRALGRRSLFNGPTGSVEDLFPFPKPPCEHRFATVTVDDLLTPSLVCRDCKIALPHITVEIIRSP